MKLTAKLIVILGTFFMLSCMDMYNEVEEELGTEYNYFLAVGTSDPGIRIYSLNTPSIPSLVNTESTTSTVYGIAIHPSGNYLYALVRNTNSIRAYSISENGKLNFIDTYTTPVNSPNLAIVHPSGKYLYVSVTAENYILAYSINSNGTLEIIGDPGYVTTPANSGPEKMVIHSSGKYLYVALSNGAGLSILEINTNGSLTLKNTKSVGENIFDLAVHPNGNYIYASSYSSSNIYKYDLDTVGQINSSTPTIKSIGSSYKLSYIINPQGDYIYIKESTSSPVYAYQINPDGSLASTSSDDIGIPNSNDTFPSGWCQMIVHPNGKFLYFSDIGGGNRLYYNIVLQSNAEFDHAVIFPTFGSDKIQTSPLIIRKKK